MRTCEVVENGVVCGLPHNCRGYCRKHYGRFMKHGDPLVIKPTWETGPEAELRRFWSHVDKNGPVPEYAPHLGACWLWTITLDRDGYGHFMVGGFGGKRRPAHRVAYELLVGPIPDGLTLDHLCRVRHCVNPNHLEPVTSRENIFRSPIAAAVINAQKTHCKRGHEFTPENTYVTPEGHRICRTCARDAMRKSRERQKAVNALVISITERNAADIRTVP